MKEKLIKIREALEFYGHVPDCKAPYTGGMGKLYFDCGEKAKEATTLLDSILADLDSPELVEKVAKSIVASRVCGPDDLKSHQVEVFWDSWTREAQAALNTIKEE